ncbi:proteasome lid subunit RPN8/RPN11 [Beijerinckia sp. GAS462]|nr:proteasome lid subunit RPN8/RPN11 [Beijerinckia sp. GAS462]SEC45105.1 hypothetical protein SAMN05443249_2720 [Beijerinckia sp. 28-YEA-48]
MCEKPEAGFEIDGMDLLQYEDRTFASWHTHPGSDNNLSVGDMHTFLNYPDWRHYIVGTDGTAEYFVEEGKLLQCE